jgi:WD40 repeat protein
VLHSLAHASGVCAVAFSPDGSLVATGDDALRVWSVADGALVASHDLQAAGGVADVAWSRVGDKLAACTRSHTIVVCDVRR